MARENLIHRSPKVAPYMVWNFWYIKPHTYFLHEKEKPAFSNSSSFEKLRFRGGLVWTVVLTVEIKLWIQISFA